VISRRIAGGIVCAALLLASPAHAETEPEEESGSAQRTFGWIAVAVGGATTVAGIVVAAIAASQYSDLDCPNDQCPPELMADAEDYNDLRVPSGVTIAAGLAVTGVGVAFVTLSSSDDSAVVTPVVSPGFVGVRGRF
jgi:hypothetical protein